MILIGTCREVKKVGIIWTIKGECYLYASFEVILMDTLQHHPSERPRRKPARTLGIDMGDVKSIDAA
jgi:hypothetical protein